MALTKNAMGFLLPWNSWEECNEQLHGRYGYRDQIQWQPGLDIDLECLRMSAKSMDWPIDGWIEKLKECIDSRN